MLNKDFSYKQYDNKDIAKKNMERARIFITFIKDDWPTFGKTNYKYKIKGEWRDLVKKNENILNIKIETVSTLLDIINDKIGKQIEWDSEFMKNNGNTEWGSIVGNINKFLGYQCTNKIDSWEELKKCLEISKKSFEISIKKTPCSGWICNSYEYNDVELSILQYIYDILPIVVPSSFSHVQIYINLIIFIPILFVIFYYCMTKEK